MCRPERRILNLSSRQTLALTWLCLLTAGSALRAQPGSDATFGPRAGNADRARKLYEANQERFKGEPDVLVRPGLVASRKTKQVEVLAESTGLTGNSIAEFLLVDQSSSHGYEALLWSLARPSDVHAALVFVGLRPGSAFDPDRLQFWPKGERVTIAVTATNGVALAAPLRLERLILDRKTGKALSESGFMFTGSLQKPAPAGTGTVYEADSEDPKSVASLYNERGTVLDVPRQARQGEVYETQVINPEHEFAAGVLLTLSLEPERKDGTLRVQDLVLEVAPGRADPAAPRSASDTNQPARPASFLLRDASGQTLGQAPTLEGAVTELAARQQKGFDPYLSVRFDGALKLSDVRQTCAVIGMLTDGSGLRLDPPPAGQLYFRAFLPDEKWRDPASRFAQPWELHLVRETNAISGRLVLHEEVWSDDKADPELKVSSFAAPTPQAVRARLNADAEQRQREGKQPGLPVLLVYAEADMTYGELMRFIGPALATHKTVHVFLPPER